jgi:hypothetical protein
MQACSDMQASEVEKSSTIPRESYLLVLHHAVRSLHALEANPEPGIEFEWPG